MSKTTPFIHVSKIEAHFVHQALFNEGVFFKKKNTVQDMLDCFDFFAVVGYVVLFRVKEGHGKKIADDFDRFEENDDVCCFEVLDEKGNTPEPIELWCYLSEEWIHEHLGDTDFVASIQNHLESKRKSNAISRLLRDSGLVVPSGFVTDELVEGLQAIFKTQKE